MRGSNTRLVYREVDKPRPGENKTETPDNCQRRRNDRAHRLLEPLDEAAGSMLYDYGVSGWFSFYVSHVLSPRNVVVFGAGSLAP